MLKKTPIVMVAYRSILLACLWTTVIKSLEVPINETNNGSEYNIPHISRPTNYTVDDNDYDLQLQAGSQNYQSQSKGDRGIIGRPEGVAGIFENRYHSQHSSSAKGTHIFGSSYGNRGYGDHSQSGSYYKSSLNNVPRNYGSKGYDNYHGYSPAQYARPAGYSGTYYGMLNYRKSGYNYQSNVDLENALRSSYTGSYGKGYRGNAGGAYGGYGGYRSGYGSGYGTTYPKGYYPAGPRSVYPSYPIKPRSSYPSYPSRPETGYGIGIKSGYRGYPSGKGYTGYPSGKGYTGYPNAKGYTGYRYCCYN